MHVNTQIFKLVSVFETSTPTTNKDVKCELCGMTFATHPEKEEHMKLEHKEHRGPSGVS